MQEFIQEMGGFFYFFFGLDLAKGRIAFMTEEGLHL